MSANTDGKIYVCCAVRDRRVNCMKYLPFDVMDSSEQKHHGIGMTFSVHDVQEGKVDSCSTQTRQGIHIFCSTFEHARASIGRAGQPVVWSGRYPNGRAARTDGQHGWSLGSRDDRPTGEDSVVQMG